MADAFRFEELEDALGLLTFDVPEKKVNTFSQAVLEELAGHVAALEKRTDLKGLLVRSGKPGQFIAGADLNELAMLIDAPKERIRQVLEAGHALFNRLANLPFPTVCLIEGNCMGGGTEFALAFDERLAANTSATRIALPEVKIGVIPGWGGTQRLPRLVGIHPALEMICSGDPVDAKKAQAIGLVFDAVPADQLLDEGRRLIEYLHEDGVWEQRRKRASQPLGLSEDELTFASAIAEGYLQSKTKGQYPAPLAALKAVRNGVNLPLEEGLAVEREVSMEVFGTPISANLIAVFFMDTRLGRDPGVDDPSIQPREVHRVGVLGAGLMGSGIATAHARRGIPATMIDVDEAHLADGLARARQVVESRIQAGRATPEDLASMLSLLSTGTSLQHFADCDVVVEAVTENEKLKTSLYKQLGPILPEQAILATNTSTISVTRMAESAPDPARFVGMHFFHPVDRMKLVEVVRGEKTSDETVATIVALARRIGKTPIVVRDCAGFLVNRVLLPYMSEALLLLLEGASMDEIDRAAERFGMPMGPIALHDLVGLDTACYAGKVMVAAYSDRAVEVPLLEDLVAAGRLGKKSGAGFRRFQGRRGRPVADPEIEPFLAKYRKQTRTFDESELQERLFFPMLLEATRVLEEQIVREPSHVDMGLILGTGFPPFRGGILRWCDSEGADRILQRLERYAELGKRFEPTETLKRHAETGELFYPRPGAAQAGSS